MHALILGGTGVISGAVRTELLLRGSTVSIVTRGRRAASVPASVEWLRIDRHREDALAAALSGRRFDVVIDAICFTPDEARQTVRLFRNRTDHLVVLSSVAAYRRPYHTVPTREDAESFCEDPTYRYGYEKAAMEKTLWEAAGRDLPVTVVRPSLTYGDGARNVGVLRQNAGILSRIRSGRPLVMFDDGATPWSFTFAPDIARAIAGLLGTPAAIGTAFHLASQERTTWNGLYQEFGRIAGREPTIVYLPAKELYADQPELCAHLYFEKSFPGLFDDSKLRSVVPGYRTDIGLAEGLRALVRSWERDGLEPDPLGEALEDELAAAALSRPAARVRTSSRSSSRNGACSSG
jgi:nucleoside-diphosphate-sugar epimerase